MIINKSRLEGDEPSTLRFILMMTRQTRRETTTENMVAEYVGGGGGRGVAQWAEMREDQETSS